MSMTEAEKREHAERILRNAVRDLDFCEVYEDEQLECVDEETQADIHNLIVRANIHEVTWG